MTLQTLIRLKNKTRFPDLDTPSLESQPSKHGYQCNLARKRDMDLQDNAETPAWAKTVLLFKGLADSSGILLAGGVYLKRSANRAETELFKW